MKKLGILAVLVLLVALAFVPQGVMAAPTDTAALTINAGVQGAIEVTVESFDGVDNDSTYSDSETYTGPLSLNPSTAAVPTQVGIVKVQCNFPNWDIKASEASGDGNMNDGTNTLGAALKISKITNWDLNSNSVYDDVIVDDTDTLTLSGTATSLKSTSSAPGNAPQSKSAGAFIPIEVTQVVTYDDAESSSYTITVTFAAGSF